MKSQKSTRAEIICVGSELLLGDIADTNTQYLARRLSALGIDLHFSTAVGDNLGRLTDCLRRAVSRSELIITTGGLGPTDDDITREAIAGLVHETPVVDVQLSEDLRRFFELRQMEMTTNNLKQASLIPSARPIRNLQGTAPGWWVARETGSIIALPGPPGELHQMWETEIEPLLKSGAVIVSRTLKLFDISESQVDAALKPLTPSSNPTVAVYAKQDGIYVRITAKAADNRAVQKAISPIETKVRQLLGDSIWGVDEQTQESVAASLLIKLGLSLAVGETITGGRLSAMLTSAEDSEKWFCGALILSARQSKLTAAKIANRVAEEFACDLAVAVCGEPVVDSSPAMDEIAVAIRDVRTASTSVATHRLRQTRSRTLGSYYALHHLRRYLESQSCTPQR